MATRPVVLVYQEIASLSVSPATPELNVCVAGPCFWIQDFPEDKASIKLASTYGARVTSPTAALPAGLAAVGPVDVPNNKAGAVVDAASVRVFLGAPRVEIVKGTDGVSTANSAVYSSTAVNFQTSGVKVGDLAVLSNAANDRIERRVRSVTGTELTFTDDVAAVDYVNFRIERVVADAEVPAAKVSMTGNQVTLAGGVQLSVGGVQKDVVSADVYVAYRALRTDLQDIKTIVDPKAIRGTLGRIDARNPLAAGAFVTLQNSGTVPVQYYGVPSNDLAGYTSMLGSTSGRKDVYAVVPLTQDVQVIAAFKNQFDQLADVDYALENGVPQKFRVVIGSVGELPTSKVVAQNVTGAGVETAATTQQPTTGVRFTLTDPAAHFVDDGVLPGDSLTTGGTGTNLYTVTQVLSNQRIEAERQVAGATTPAAASTYVIRRTLDKDGQVADLKAVPGSLKSRRAVICWPDRVDVAGLVDGSLVRDPTTPETPAPANTQPGFYLACAVGGMVAGMPSHQGLTNLGIAGVERIYNSNTHFTDKQITDLSNAGWLVFQQDTPQALPYIVHQMTTDTTALQTWELSMVKNFDFVSMYLADIVDDFIGPWNINKETLGFVQAAVQAGIDNLKLRKRPRIGAPINDARITSLGESSVSEDRLELYVEADFPKPLNTVGLHVVSV